MTEIFVILADTLEQNSKSGEAAESLKQQRERNLLSLISRNCGEDGTSKRHNEEQQALML